MKPLAEQYRDRLIRIVVAERPAAMVVVHQPGALDDFCNLLADCADAKELLRAKGYGQVGMSILEVVQLLPAAGAPHPRNGRKRRR